MKCLWLLFLCATLAIAHAETEDDASIDLNVLADLDDASLDEELLDELEKKYAELDKARENELAVDLLADDKPVIEIDPCEKMLCGAGRICQLIDNKPQCVCIPECPEESDERRLVCTNTNQTWPSDCAVYQQRCFCLAEDKGCKDPENVHLHIDYYGSCHELKNCSEEEMADFPRRMRDWLSNVMRDLAERDALTDHYMQMELEAETDMSRRWANAAIWKWCDLDGDTDRSVSRHELFPIRAPLVSLEHCVAPFFESCDSNKDHRITLVEWGTCLGLKEEELNGRCDEIHRNTPQLTG